MVLKCPGPQGWGGSTRTGRSALKFVFVTTFHGAESFGGDAAYVDRLATALLRGGHRVEVVHCGDAFNVVRGKHPLRPYQPPEGLVVRRLASRFGPLSPILTQATGRPWLKRPQLRAILEAPDVDVVHFHNISLVGGVGVLSMGRNAVRLMTAHEHWLTCPMHLLWKMDRASCDKPQCGRCMIQGRRPPQLWRRTGLIDRGLKQLDALLFPSHHALGEHMRRGIRGPMSVLPYFLPDGWPGEALGTIPKPERPYLAAAGRLVKMKGFQRVIPLMKYLPEADLRIAGTGPYEKHLRKLAEGIPNVRFEGLLGGADLARLFAGSRAVVVPSLFPETFGYVVLEAFAVRAPVIVHRGGGAILETGAESGGGLPYSTDDELLLAMRRLVHDDPLREGLAERGHEVHSGAWSESAHLEAYLGLIERLQARRIAGTPHSASASRPYSRLGIRG